MLRLHAALSVPDDLEDAFQTVRRITGRSNDGFSEGDVRGQIAARRWQRFGRAVVLHNGALHPAERRGVALINAGPPPLLTALPGAPGLRLPGWGKAAVDVLVPGGARGRRPPHVP